MLALAHVRVSCERVGLKPGHLTVVRLWLPGLPSGLLTTDVNLVSDLQLIKTKPPTCGEERMLVGSTERSARARRDGVGLLDPRDPGLDQPRQPDRPVSLFVLHHGR